MPDWGWVACTHHDVLMDIGEQVMGVGCPLHHVGPCD